MLARLQFASVLTTIIVLTSIWTIDVVADNSVDLGDRYLCPGDTVLMREGQCRGHCTSDYSYTPGLQRAIDQCRPINAYPVTIKTDEQQKYWLTQFYSGYSYFPIGIVCDESSKKYKWIAGSSIDYKPDKIDNALEGDCNSDVWWYLYTDGGWYQRSNSDGIHYTLCCVTDIYHPSLSDDECLDFTDDTEDSVCYQISETYENLSDAQKICRNAGSKVASVHNDNENSWLRRLAVSRGFTNGLLLGAQTGISGKSDSFGWADGSDWEYENFYPGFPYDGFGDCLVMATNEAGGLWTNVECSVKLPFVCARNRNSVPETSTACPGPNVKAGDIITSPGYPMNASIFCDFFLKVDSGKKVQMEILLLEANTCCDHLQIYEGTFGGALIADVTGAITNKTYSSPTNQMRVSWIPNGGVNVRGVMFTFKAV